MKYDFSKSYDEQKARIYFENLVNNECKCEVKKINPKRSLSANRYVHVLFGIWGKEWGYFMDESKQTVKHALEYYTVNDKGAVIYTKTSEMSSSELAIFVDKFRDWSAINGLYLPTPSEFEEERIYFENLIEK